MNKEALIEAYNKRQVVVGIVDNSEFIEGKISMVSIREIYIAVNPNSDELESNTTIEIGASIRVSDKDFHLDAESIFSDITQAKESMTTYFYDKLSKIQQDIDRLKIPIQTEAKASEVKL